MSAATKAEARIARGRRAPSAPTLAAPLDLLLADATRSPLRRFLPGMSGVRFTASLARRPQRVAGRALGLAAELAKVGVGRSELAAAREGPPLRRGGAGPRTRCSGAPCRATSRSARPRAGWSTDAELGWGDDQRMGFIVDNLVEASAPSNNPFLNPKVLKRIARHRRRQPRRGRPPLRPRLRQRAAGAVDGRARRVRGRHRHRGDARGGGAAHRRLRADPVHPADPQGPLDPAADRAADDQQVLRDRPRRAAQPGRAPGRRAASRSTASPGATPTPGTPTGAWTPTARRSSRRWTPAEKISRQDQVAAARHLLRRDARLDGARAPRRHRRPRPGGGLQPRGHRARPGAGRTAQRAAVAQGGGGLDAGRRRRRATSTARCSPRCSPGCGPTT